MQRWSDSGKQWKDLYFFMEVEFFFQDYQIANGWMERPESFFSQARHAGINPGLEYSAWLDIML